MTTLMELKKEPSRVAIGVCLETDLGFESMQRIAKMLSSSSIVPVIYRAKIEKLDRFGNVTSSRDNQSALPNCFVALNMSQSIKADVLMVMQNLNIIEGKPSWSSTYTIASINACGKYSPLRYELEDLGEKEVEYINVKWVDQKKIETPVSIKIKNTKCVAWAIEKATGERLESPPVTMELAVKEGWYSKNGSKWKTMPELMLRYRAATFFGRLYSPELLVGLQTTEEVEDCTFDLVSNKSGAYTINTENIRNPEEPNFYNHAAGLPKQTKMPKTNDDLDPINNNTVMCPKNSKQIDELLNCPDCKEHEGCPALK